MSKIQITELNNSASELEMLNKKETTKIIGGGNINNNQGNSAGVFQSTFFGSNASLVSQINDADNSNYDSYYSSYRYGYGWYY